MAQQTFSPASQVRGAVRVPGDKSISHRALIAAAMTNGECRIKGLASGADVRSTRSCLQALGYPVQDNPGEVTLSGNGWRPNSYAELDAGNSGTTMRLLAGALSATNGRYRLTGDASLSRRPMARVAEPLNLMGAKIELAHDGHAPMDIEGGSLQGIDYRMPVASAQVKGAILLAALRAGGVTKITEPHHSRDHTERMLDWLGAKITSVEGTIEIAGADELFMHPGFDLSVPSDISSAAFFAVAACLSKKGRVQIDHVGLNPTRTGFLDALSAMGAVVGTQVEKAHPEPLGKLTAASSRLHGTEISGELIPRAIDELPLLALAATQADGETLIRDAAELRAKESDRIAVLAQGLRALGAEVEELPDGLVVRGPTPLKGGVVDSQGDHRIALTFAVAGTIAAGPVSVRGWECAGISYPGFEQDLAAIAS